VLPESFVLQLQVESSKVYISEGLEKDLRFLGVDYVAVVIERKGCLRGLPGRVLTVYEIEGLHFISEFKFALDLMSMRMPGNTICFETPVFKEQLSFIVSSLVSADMTL